MNIEKDSRDPKSAKREYDRQYRLKNKDKIQEYNRQYYSKNKLKIKIKAIKNEK